jgi:hypothetical protein
MRSYTKLEVTPCARERLQSPVTELHRHQVKFSEDH